MNTTELVDKLIVEFSSSPRVVVIDDDEHFVHLFRTTLEHCGCIVDVCTETRDAVDKIKFQLTVGKPYDIIFLDLKMPPDHGVYVLAKAKELVPKTPVVIVTGYPDSDLVAEALRYGYLGMVQKPINMEELELLFWKHKLSLQNNL